MVPSNSPTDIKIYAIPGVGVEVHAVFHQANSLPGIYAQFQVSTDPNFGTTDYDSGQVSIDSIADGTEGIMVFGFIPSSPDTYYYRLCFWDDDNYTRTDWQVWNGSTVQQVSKDTDPLYPLGDYSVSGNFSTHPTFGDPHYTEIDDPASSPDDSDTYINMYSSTSEVTACDYYDWSLSISDTNFIKITTVTAHARAQVSDTTYEYEKKVGLESYDGSIPEKLVYVNSSTYDNFTMSDDGLSLSVDDFNNAKVGLYGYIDGRTVATELDITQYYVVVTYLVWDISYSPTYENVVVGFPTIVSQQVKNG